MPLTGAPLCEEESFVLDARNAYRSGVVSSPSDSAVCTSLASRRVARLSERRPSCLLDCGPSRFDPKRGQREVAGEFSEPDSEGMVFEAACGCCENAEELYVRLNKGKEESGDSLCGHLAGVRSFRMR